MTVEPLTHARCAACGHQEVKRSVFCSACGHPLAGQALAHPAPSFVGRNCPYCRFPLKEGVDAAQCPVCGAVHHADCFNDNGGCAVLGCTRALAPAERDRPGRVSEAPVTEAFGAMAGAPAAAEEFRVGAGATATKRPRIGWRSAAVALATVTALGGAAAAVVFATSTPNEHVTTKIVSSPGQRGGPPRGPVVNGPQTTSPAPTTIPSQPVGDNPGWPPDTSAYTVALGSFRVHANADTLLARARADGLDRAAYVWSSDYSSLQPGWWFVFSGVFSDRAGAAAAAQHARDLGYTDAYARYVSR